MHRSTVPAASADGPQQPDFNAALVWGRLSGLSQHPMARRALGVGVAVLLAYYAVSKSVEIGDRSLLVLLNGLTAAGLYFLMASGFTLVFGLARVTNLAHGGIYLLGGYGALSVQRSTGNWFLAALLGALFAGGVSVVLYLVLRLLRGDGLRETMLTLGATIVIADQVLANWGGIPTDLDPPSFLTGSIDLPGSTLLYPKFRLAVVVLAFLAGLLLWVLLYKTRLGMLIRAGVDDPEMVSVLGIRVPLVLASVFALAGALAGIAGAAGGTYLSLAQGEDNRILLASLIVVIAGGLGSLRGAGAASVIVGLVEAFAQTHHPVLSVLITFGMLTAILVLRPHGLMGGAADASA
ncbi:MAG: branched-chain amino acid ABC transporter permease [Acidimicrobiia bacterium]|nr:branched-chain amino acid ABC transporter permease [Acidimicrobiia bacterium]MYB73882.1 branched-chain amino acid ABC transporter permease [Acidimicrobiia bacterium]MYE72172.1 branched-chain amino acid ABC transporter permease [Acidimicrobiia bacterium]MYH99499.1 branched-chain amino acid ABC transporter permease [Acidimicrobiia bacterium]MYJ61931.1 branched-chain amino acid ABC transporter permease [Acidimicrobiia bacterium]